jgi:hypothetical protein
MDIHKPKPWHGWPEFLKEVGTIVVGVLIALAGEQLVEGLRVRHELAEVQSALDKSVQYNLVWTTERVALGPCLDARITELRDRLAAAGDTWRADPQTYAGPTAGALSIVPEAYHTPKRVLTLAAWQAALASRDISAMPLAQRSRYSVMFANFHLFISGQAREHEISADLDALSFNLRMTPELRAHFLGRLAALAREEALAASNGSQGLALAHRYGFAPDKALLAQTIADQRRFRGACVADVKP